MATIPTRSACRTARSTVPPTSRPSSRGSARAGSTPPPWSGSRATTTGGPCPRYSTPPRLPLAARRKAAPVPAATEVTAIVSPKPTAAPGPPRGTDLGPTPSRPPAAPGPLRRSRGRRGGLARVRSVEDTDPVPLAGVAALVTAGALWWMRGQPERDRRFPRCGGATMPKLRRYARAVVFGRGPAGCASTCPTAGSRFPPTTRCSRRRTLAFAWPTRPREASAGLSAESLPRVFGPLDADADRIGRQRQPPGQRPSLREPDGQDVAVSGSPGRRASYGPASGDGQPRRRRARSPSSRTAGSSSRSRHGARATPPRPKLRPARGPGPRASGTAMARRSACSTRSNRRSARCRSSAGDGRGAGARASRPRRSPRPTSPQTSLRVVSPGLPAHSDESQEIGASTPGVQAAHGEGAGVRLAAWMQQVRTGAVPIARGRGQAGRQLLRQGIGTCPRTPGCVCRP